MTVTGLRTIETAPVRRSEHGCICCGSLNIYRETTIVSSFIALRAMCRTPELTCLVFCRQCGMRFYDRGLSKTEAARYYEGYRNDDYHFQRNRHEPFYTRRAHEQIASWLASSPRRQALSSALAASKAPREFNSVLDYGGGDGRLIQDVACTHRAVFDLAGATPVDGIQVIGAVKLAQQNWNLIVCAQTLEHVSDPLGLVAEMVRLLTPGGWLYLEVPDEMWSNHSLPGPARDRWLGWLTRHPSFLVAADTLSTACRILLGFLPPFGFIPMREHLQYFTEDALSALVKRSGMNLAGLGRNSVGQIYAIATKGSAEAVLHSA
jgi:SAM-dependent methyltransferase